MEVEEMVEEKPKPLIPGPYTAHRGWADSQVNMEILENHPNWCEITGQSDKDKFSVSGHCGIANARMMAAAPDLLAALEALTTDFLKVCGHADSDPANSKGLNLADAAIAKAVITSHIAWSASHERLPRAS